MDLENNFRQHIAREDWLFTTKHEPRGYIQPDSLKELWFHTGTICNLNCPFCLEGSKPGDNRLNYITFADAKTFIDEALGLGVEKFSFTGGEPFVVKGLIQILDYALDFRPCLVLTNATAPLQLRFDQLRPLLKKSNKMNFRVSLDYPHPDKHDAGRGAGNFFLAFSSLKKLHELGFGVSIARQRTKGEDKEKAARAYIPFLEQAGLPLDMRIVSFPDFLTPGSNADVPQITETCMTKYHTEETRAKFMCAFSKMVIKRDGKMLVSACTLVDDDKDYDLGSNLKDTMNIRIMLKHHRCYSCFAAGASCSEM